MKTLFILPIAALILAGCAEPGPRYATRSVDPYQWHTVSVTPVQPGTVASQQGRVEYTTEAAPAYAQQPTYVQQPAYVADPVYVPAPYYYAPAPAYYYPPVTLGLDFVWFGGGGHRGGWCCRGRRH